MVADKKKYCKKCQIRIEHIIFREQDCIEYTKECITDVITKAHNDTMRMVVVEL